MNILFVSLAILALGVLIVLLVLCRMLILKKCCRPVVSLFMMLERKLMLNSVLRAMLETYLSLAI